jgi:hypothetical protein
MDNSSRAKILIKRIANNLQQLFHGERFCQAFDVGASFGKAILAA